MGRREEVFIIFESSYPEVASFLSDVAKVLSDKILSDGVEISTLGPRHSNISGKEIRFSRSRHVKQLRLYYCRTLRAARGFFVKESIRQRIYFWVLIFGKTDTTRFARDPPQVVFPLARNLNATMPYLNLKRALILWGGGAGSPAP